MKSLVIPCEVSGHVAIEVCGINGALSPCLSTRASSVPGDKVPVVITAVQVGGEFDVTYTFRHGIETAG